MTCPRYHEDLIECHGRDGYGPTMQLPDSPVLHMRCPKCAGCYDCTAMVEARLELLAD